MTSTGYPRAKVWQDLAILLGCGLLPLLWFDHRYIVTGGDANFPLDHAQWLLSRLFVWNNQFNTGVEAAINPSTLFFHGVQAFFHWLGATLSQAQRLSYVFWFTLQAWAIYLLVAVIQADGRPSRLERFVSVAVYAFVPIMFNVWEVGKAAELSCLVGMPFVLAVCIYALRTRRWWWAIALISVVSPVFSEAGAGPPVFAIPLFVIAIWACFHLAGTAPSSRGAEARTLGLFLLGLAVCYMLANAYWVFPYLHEIHSKVLRNPTGGLQAFNLTDWLQGISTNTSLLNVSRFQGAWDWYYGFNGEDYIPYARRFLENPLFIVLSLLLPVAAYSALALRRTRWVVCFATISAVMTLFATGAHPPFGPIYLWLTKHVPFFTMFRSPYYKFGLAVAMAYAYLIGVTAGELVRRAAAWQAPVRWSWMAKAPWPRVTAAAVFVVVLGYGHPMLTGEIVFGHTKMPSLKLQIPPYVFEAARWLDSSPSDGRILSLPRDAIDNYRWGYGSILHLMNLITMRPVLYSREFASVFEAALKVRETYYDSLYRARTPFTHKILALLHADFILLRTDSWYDMYTNAVSPAALRNILLDQSGVALARTIGAWEFYSTVNPPPKARVVTSLGLVKGGQGQALVPLTYTDRLDAGHAVIFTEDIPARATLQRLMATPLVDALILFNARLRDLAMDLVGPQWVHRVMPEPAPLTIPVAETGVYVILVNRRDDPRAEEPILLTPNALVLNHRQLLPIPVGPGDGPVANGRWRELGQTFFTQGTCTVALAVDDPSIESVAVIPREVWSGTLHELRQWLSDAEGPDLFVVHPTEYMRTVIRDSGAPDEVSEARVARLHNFYRTGPAIGVEASWQWLQVMYDNIFVQNTASHPVSATLAFEVMTLGQDRDLRVSRDDDQLSVDLLRSHQTYRSVIRDIRFAPGLTALKLWSPYSASRVPGERWEETPQGRSFAFRRIEVGPVDFLDELELPREGTYQIMLYPYPASKALQQQLLASPGPALQLGGQPVQLTVRRDPDSGYGWYESETLTLPAGVIPVQFSQRHGEQYYLLVRSRDRSHPVHAAPSSYDRQNLVKYRVQMPRYPSLALLVLSETHSPHWWAAEAPTAGTQAGRRWWEHLILSDLRALLNHRLPEEDHLLVNGYANGWLLSPEEPFRSSQRATVLIYMPQLLLEIGAVVSGLTLVASGIILLNTRRGRRRRP